MFHLSGFISICLTLKFLSKDLLYSLLSSIITLNMLIAVIKEFKVMLKFFMLFFILLLLTFAMSWAGEAGHYVCGIGGLKCASLPPPGLYYCQYNVLYTASSLKGTDGSELPVGFDLDIRGVISRIAWMTKYKVLGANYGMDMIIPYLRIESAMSSAGILDQMSGLCDIGIEPVVLSWSKPRYDLSTGIAFFLPTGRYNIARPSSPGKNFSTTMFSLGGTYYFDEKKTWSVSALSRYETHGTNSDKNISPGNTFSLDWGVGRTIISKNHLLNVGLVGYLQRQVTDDTGTGVNYDNSIHDKVYALGLEANFTSFKGKYTLSICHFNEYSAIDRPEGRITNITFIKPL